MCMNTHIDLDFIVQWIIHVRHAVVFCQSLWTKRQLGDNLLYAEVFSAQRSTWVRDRPLPRSGDMAVLAEGLFVQDHTCSPSACAVAGFSSKLALGGHNTTVVSIMVPCIPSGSTLIRAALTRVCVRWLGLLLWKDSGMATLDHEYK